MQTWFFPFCRYTFLTLLIISVGSAPSRTGSITAEFAQYLDRPRSSSVPTVRQMGMGPSAVIPPSSLSRSQNHVGMVNGTSNGSSLGNTDQSAPSPTRQSPIPTSPARSPPSGITLKTTLQIIQVGLDSIWLVWCDFM